MREILYEIAIDKINMSVTYQEFIQYPVNNTYNTKTWLREQAIKESQLLHGTNLVICVTHQQEKRKNMA